MMDGMRGPAILFAEDFEDDMASPHPPIHDAGPTIEIPADDVVPLFTRDDMDAARADGFRAGQAAANAAIGARQADAIAALAAGIDHARDAAARCVDESADALAHLLLASFRAAFPTLWHAHGANEAAAVLRAVLPGLVREPRARVLASARTLRALAPELAALDPERAVCLHLTEAPGMTDGDIRILWDKGRAERTQAAVWQDIEAVLSGAGLSTAPPEAALHKEKADA